MLKKGSLVLLLVGTVNTASGWWSSSDDGAEDRSNVPCFTQKINDDFGLDDAKSQLSTMTAFIEAKKQARDNCDNKIKKVLAELLEIVGKQVKTDKLEELQSQLPPYLHHRRKVEEEVKQAEANKKALESQINCYQEKESVQEGSTFEVDQQDNNLDDPDLDLTQDAPTQE